MTESKKTQTRCEAQVTARTKGRPNPILPTDHVHRWTYLGCTDGWYYYRGEWNLPNAIVKGCIYETQPELNGQDCLEIELPSGRILDVGWYPDCDPAGEFWIRVWQDDWNNQLIDPIKTRDPHEVKRIVEKLAAEHSTT